MADHFTCRLIAERTDSGKSRLRYGYLGDGYRFFTFTGPAAVLPPAGELSDEELDRWEASLYARGFSMSMAATPVGTALVECRRTCEDRIPKGAVRCALFAHELPDGRRTLGAEAANGWREPVPGLELRTCWEAEAPQPVAGAAAERMGLREAGGSETLARLPPGVPGPAWGLLPGRAARFYLPPTFLPAVRSRAAALSPESHWLALYTDGYEFDRLGGAELAAFLERLG